MQQAESLSGTQDSKGTFWDSYLVELSEVLEVRVNVELRGGDRRLRANKHDCVRCFVHVEAREQRLSKAIVEREACQ